MILKALYDYYQRSNNLPRKGLELKEIAFLLVLDSAGNFIRFEDRRIDSKHAQEFLVTKAVERTSAPRANHLYDYGKYVLGYSEDGREEQTLKCFKVFKAKIREIYESNIGCPEIEAVYQFYQNDIKIIHELLHRDPLWDEVRGNSDKKIFSFIIEGETKILAEKQDLFNITLIFFFTRTY